MLPSLTDSTSQLSENWFQSSLTVLKTAIGSVIGISSELRSNRRHREDVLPRNDISERSPGTTDPVLTWLLLDVDQYSSQPLPFDEAVPM